MTRTSLSNGEGTRAVESNGEMSAWPLWFERSYLIGLATAGVAIDWYCAFEWFSTRYSFWSETVFYRMLLIVLPCAAIGLLSTFPRRGRWQVGVVVFFFASVNVSGNLLLWWVGHR